MVPKKTAKLIKSLHLKKYRKKTGLFLVEGTKSVLELLQSHINTKTLISTEVFLNDHREILNALEKEIEIYAADEHLLTSLGSFKTNNAAMAIAEIPVLPVFRMDPEEYVLMLDDVRDPGNLGTIIRIADWYGIDKIICSPETTDAYSPKVVHATMGSFLRVKLYYEDLGKWLSATRLPVFGALLDGKENVHTLDFGMGGVILLGNESEGIRKEWQPLINRKICIPSYGHAESLNVAVAAAVICDNMRRQKK